MLCAAVVVSQSSLPKNRPVPSAKLRVRLRSHKGPERVRANPIGALVNIPDVRTASLYA